MGVELHRWRDRELRSCCCSPAAATPSAWCGGQCCSGWGASWSDNHSFFSLVRIVHGFETWCSALGSLGETGCVRSSPIHPYSYFHPCCVCSSTLTFLLFQLLRGFCYFFFGTLLPMLLSNVYKALRNVQQATTSAENQFLPVLFHSHQCQLGTLPWTNLQNRKSRLIGKVLW